MAFFFSCLFLQTSRRMLTHRLKSRRRQELSVMLLPPSGTAYTIKHLPAMFDTIEHILTSPGPIKFSFCP